MTARNQQPDADLDESPTDDKSAGESTEASEMHPVAQADVEAPNAFVRTLWWSAGANPRLLAHKSCWLERARYSVSGASVLITALLAALSASIVFMNFVTIGAALPSALAGIVWGSVILCLDRLLLLTLIKRSDGRSNATLWMVLPRIGLAVLVATAVAIPAELVLFRKQLDVQVRVDQQTEIATQQQQLAARYGEIPDLLGQRAALAGQNTLAAQAASAAFNAAACEGDGTCGSGLRGAGVLHAEKIARFQQLRADAIRTESNNKPSIRTIDARLQVLEGQRDQDMAAFEGTARSSDDLLGRLMALKHLEQDPKHGGTVTLAAWLVRLLSLCLELLPLVVKLSAPHGPYDAAFQAIQDGESAQWAAVREKSLQEAGVLIEQERLISASVVEASRDIVVEATAESLKSPSARKARNKLSREILERSVATARRAAADVFDDRRLHDEVRAAGAAFRRKADVRVVEAEGRRAKAFDDLDAAVRTAEGLRGEDAPLH